MNTPDEIPSGSPSTSTPSNHLVVPLSARATAARLRISASPTRSVRPIAVVVKEGGETPWRVITVAVEGNARWYGDPPYPACPGNRWIDVEVECPHDRPPTEAAPIELRGVVVCEASDLPVCSADTERDRQWEADFRGPRSERKTPNGWEVVHREMAESTEPDDRDGELLHQRAEVYAEQAEREARSTGQSMTPSLVRSLIRRAFSEGASSVRSQAVAFRSGRLAIGSTPSNWLIGDIKVSNRSQLAGKAPKTDLRSAWRRVAAWASGCLRKVSKFLTI